MQNETECDVKIVNKKHRCRKQQLKNTGPAELHSIKNVVKCHMNQCYNNNKAVVIKTFHQQLSITL